MTDKSVGTRSVGLKSYAVWRRRPMPAFTEQLHLADKDWNDNYGLFLYPRRRLAGACATQRRNLLPRFLPPTKFLFPATARSLRGSRFRQGIQRLLGDSIALRELNRMI